MNDLISRLSDRLDWPKRKHVEATPISPVLVRVNGEIDAIAISGTQYLGALWHPAVRRLLESVRSDASHWGSVGSSYLGGVCPERRRFERRIAAYAQEDAALAFSNGWAACFAVAETLGRTCDDIISDASSHNSVICGLQKARAHVRVQSFTENGIPARVGDRAACITTLISGISGEVSRVDWAANRDSFIWVRDDCHGFGAVGTTGFEVGTVDRPDLRIVSCSKALGIAGAAIVGRADLIALVEQLASPWIFSTPLPAVLWEINTEMLPIIAQMREERVLIRNMANVMRSELAEKGIAVSGDSHITGIHIAPEKLPSYEDRLLSRGVFGRVSQYPTRPREDPCMRVSVNPWTKSQQLGQIVEAIVYADSG